MEYGVIKKLYLYKNLVNLLKVKSPNLFPGQRIETLESRYDSLYNASFVSSSTNTVNMYTRQNWEYSTLCY